MALKNQYYKGLKEEVKDKIMRSLWPDDLDTIIVLAISYDKHIYTRKQERKGWDKKPTY